MTITPPVDENVDGYIVLWRKTGEKCLDWDFHVCSDLEEASQVVTTIKAQGVRQYRTRPIGSSLPDLSSEY